VSGILVATDCGTFSPIISTQSAGKNPTWQNSNRQHENITNKYHYVENAK